MDDHRPAARPSRRALLRAGGTAAWSVPAIVAVSAAPAHAEGSGQSSSLVLAPGSAVGTGDDPARIDFSGTMTNGGSTPLTSGRLVITMTITDGKYRYGGVDPPGTQPPAVRYWNYVNSPSTDGRSYVTQTWDLVSSIGAGDTVLLPPVRYQAMSVPFTGQFAVSFQTPAGVVVASASTSFRSRPEDEEGGKLTLATSAVRNPGGGPRTVIHRGTLTNTGAGVGSGRLVVTARLTNGAAWAGGSGNTPSPQPTDPGPAPVGWDSGSGGYVGSDGSTIEVVWTLQTPLRAGATTGLPPIQFIADRDTFSGSITTTFTPNDPTTVNGPVVASFSAP